MSLYTWVRVLLTGIIISVVVDITLMIGLASVSSHLRDVETQVQQDHMQWAHTDGEVKEMHNQLVPHEADHGD